MNNDLLKILSDHLLADSNNAIRVQSFKNKLSKGKASVNKFAFNLPDIIEKFGGVDNLLNELPNKGFSKQVKFTLVKCYKKNERISYHTIEEITKDLIEEKVMETQQNSAVQNNNQSQYPINYPNNQNNSLGAIMGHPEVFNSMIEARRSEDYKRRAEQAEEKLKNSESENRILKEKISSYEIKLATIKDKSDLERERDKLERKGFFDSEAGSSVLETLGALLPKVVDVVAAQKGVPTAPAPALGNPQVQVSETKQMAIQIIQSQNFSEDQTNIVNYILTNWQPDLIQGIQDLIYKRENNES
ncbi:hypothetical protein [uncultured Tenacibaculum sp.]|uniref:hypothetical protein n=1 Tax=uncultured Tenacibaculum sp. TaxID=174713 RepID=UPI00260DDB1C|nr:hypothetical protein [uncultured Tenacibaculum sp.]